MKFGIKVLFGLEGVGEWKIEGVREWKCEESLGCLDWGMLEWMCEESLFKLVNDMMVVKDILIIFNGINCKITNLSLCIKK